MCSLEPGNEESGVGVTDTVLSCRFKEGSIADRGNE